MRELVPLKRGHSYHCPAVMVAAPVLRHDARSDHDRPEGRRQDRPQHADQRQRVAEHIVAEDVAKLEADHRKRAGGG